MQVLKRLSSSPEAVWYAVEGDYQTAVRRWVVSTPPSREICNRPELLGCRYTDALREAMTAALVHAPFRSLIERHPQPQVCVLHFLRGGLNFGLRDALHAAYGFNAHSSAFLSSQRCKVDGRWQVHEDMYRKIHVPAGALIVTGDVVATGVTVENGLRVLLEHLKEIGSSIRGLVFFTIGCHKLEKQLNLFEPLLREAFPDFEGSHVVYLEGKLRLVDSRTPLHIGIPGTDLIRLDCLLAPEAEASLYDKVSYPLERCAIYDAGSRAFDIPSYVEDVVGYWQQVAGLARQGFTLAAALRERWPAREYESLDGFMARKRELWHGVGESELRALFERHRQRWTESFALESERPGALEAVCAERIATLSSALE